MTLTEAKNPSKPSCGDALAEEDAANRTYLVAVCDFLSRGSTAVVASNSSDLASLRRIEAVAMRMASDSNTLLEEARKARTELEDAMVRARYANPSLCHECHEEFRPAEGVESASSGSLKRCFCFDEEKRTGVRLCGRCVEVLVAAARKNAAEEGGLRQIPFGEASYAKCQRCGTFKCSDKDCREVLECMECGDFCLCVECARNKDSGFIKCRCNELFLCTGCKEKLMSREAQDDLESEHRGAKQFFDNKGGNTCIVGTTCRCYWCTKGKPTWRGRSLIKIVPCSDCKELIHHSNRCENEGDCAIWKCCECGTPENEYNLTCLRCKEGHFPDFNLVRQWKGREPRDDSFAEWKCHICRRGDDEYDY